MNSLFSFLIFAFLTISCKYSLAEDLKLLILHNNDIHARFEETSARSGVCKPKNAKNKNCYGGFGRMAHVIRQAREDAKIGKGPHVLYLNAGDTYTGTPWFSVHKWKIVADFLNLLKPDVISFGNHEFDMKVDGVVPFVNAAEFPIVAANLDFSKEPKLQATSVTKSYVLNVAGRKIGVIGYLTPETQKISAPEKVIFVNEIDAIKMESEKLDNEGVKIIIALGHSGYAVDRKIAKEVPLVDLVVGGHTNTFLWNGPKPDLEEPEGEYPTVVTQSSGKKVPVVQAYAYTKYMGRLNITFNEKGDAIEYQGQPLLLVGSIPQDPDMLRLLELYRPEVEALDREVIAKSLVNLDGDAKSCRAKECNFANLITDAYVAYQSGMYGGSFWTDTPIAIVNGGGIRNSIEPKTSGGKITRGELLGAMPFQDNIYMMNMKGSDLWKTLEIGVRSNGETSRGEFIQSSGIHYKVNLAKPVGSRVEEVKVRCGFCDIPTYEPLKRNKVYKIITTGFLNSGGDGHVAIRDGGYNKTIADLLDIDIVAWYMNKTSPIYPEESERIEIYHSGGREHKEVSIFVLLSFVFTLILFR